MDLIVERANGGVLAFEVKAAAQAAGADTRHLVKLWEALEERFLGGFVLYTGPHSYRLGDRLLAMPIDRLWASP